MIFGRKAQQIYYKLVGIESASDEKLMGLVATGDEAAFSILYMRYRKQAFFYLKRMVKDAALAEELTHEVFMKLFVKSYQYKEGQKFAPWFWTSIRNMGLDQLKKKDALNFTNELPEDFTVEHLAMVEETPEQITIDKNSKEQVASCLAELNPYQKEALTLQLYSELSYQEIAQTMEISLASVKAVINRAKKSLLRCLRGYLGNE